MKVPEAKATGYAVLTILVAIALTLVAGAVVGAISTRIFPRDLSDASIGTTTVRGANTFDADKVNSTAIQTETKAEQAAALDAARKQAAGVTAPATLAAMLPASIGGWSRSAVESASGAVSGHGISHAEGTYKSGDKEFRLTITDNSASSAAGVPGAAVQIRSNRQDDNGYEKIGPINGRMTTERWNKTGDGTYNVLFGNRFLVEAQGQASDIAMLKSAVGSVDTAKLEAMAK